MTARLFVFFLVALVAFTGCNTLRKIAGLPEQADPSVNRPAESRWLLVQNPRFGDVPSEPEYIWVEEDKVPTTLKTLVRGTGSIIAPPEVVARYGAPPGGGRISPRQGVPAAPPGAPRPVAAAPAGGARPPGLPPAVVAAPVEMPRRGYVVHVDTNRIAIDLTSVDGLRPGALVSVRREKTPIVHPVTGEVLGELDEEVGVARVVELREKFSVAEVQSVHPGSQIQLRDRVVQK